jgi:hypothetical protein
VSIRPAGQDTLPLPLSRRAARAARSGAAGPTPVPPAPAASTAAPAASTAAWDGAISDPPLWDLEPAVPGVSVLALLPLQRSAPPVTPAIPATPAAASESPRPPLGRHLAGRHLADGESRSGLPLGPFSGSSSGAAQPRVRGRGRRAR